MNSDAALAPRPASRFASIALAVVLVFGVLVRLVGQTTIQLWLDEADWALRAENGTDTFIRPVGQMWLARHTIALHNSELVLRLPSLIGGIAALPLLYLVLRRLVRPGIAVLGVLALVAHPVAIGMSKEFKPYALEAALHLLVLWLTLRFLHKPSPRTALHLVATTTFAPLLSWSVVFSYPGPFLAAGLQRLGERWREMKPTVLAFSAGLVTTLLLLAAVFAARVGGEDRKPEYWGKKYGVFYVGDDVDAQLQWIAGQLLEVLRWTLDIDLPRPVSSWLMAAAPLCAAIAVVALLVRRRFMVLALVTLPIVTTVIFNVLGQWPWGLFRANAWLVPITLILMTIGIDALVDLAAKLHPRVPVVLGVVVALAAVAVAPRWWSHADEKPRKSLAGQSWVLSAIELLREHEQQTPTSSPPAKTPLLLHHHACGVLRYYKDHHTQAMATHKAWIDEHLDVRCIVPGSDWNAFLDSAAGESFWLITMMRQPRELRRTLARLQPRCTLRHEHRWRNTAMVYCKARAADPTTPPTPAASPIDEGDDGDGDDEAP